MTKDDKTHSQHDSKTVVEPYESNRVIKDVPQFGLSGSEPVTDARLDGSALSMNSDKTRAIPGAVPMNPTWTSGQAYQTSSPNRLFVPSVPSPLLKVGDVLKNRFEILEVLGQGGMGMVFKALDKRKQEAKSRNPYVAIKVLSPALAKNTLLIAGLERECEKAQELSHPNIITVYDFDRDGDFVFMSMEYLVGQPLSKIIRESSLSGGVKLERAWPIISKMGEALIYAHQKHIVHSDFKPANVFVTDNNEVKVLDFGIASRLGQTNADETIFDPRTEGGLTPPYASFEMLNGSRADPRDDIYAFGLVVYELLTGKHPYDRKPASNMFLEQRRSGQTIMPNPVPGLSRKQWQLLKSAIELLQEQRPKRLDDWLEEFDPKRQATWFHAVAAGLVLLLGGIGYLVFHLNPSIKNAVEGQAPVTQQAVEIPQSIKQAEISPPPIANAGSDLTGSIGETVVLNGSKSSSQNGGPLKYHWYLKTRPLRSKVALTHADSLSPQFVPDQPGQYIAELTVSDDTDRVSMPVNISINVVQPTPPTTKADAVLHESTSEDGVLNLASNKSKYMIGEDLVLNFRVAKAGYLRVAYVSSMGEINELLPNKYQSSKVKAGVEYRIPPKSQSFKLQVAGPTGIDKVVAVFSERSIPKVKNIVNEQGLLVNELQNLASSTSSIQYDVVKKESVRKN